MTLSTTLGIGALPITAPDTTSGIPLYRQVEDDLRRLISEGVLPPGGTLPPELELSHTYGVGRQTVRMALSRLAADDLIARFAGRGTFVRVPSDDRRKFYLDCSFTRQMAELGLQAHSKVLEIGSGTISPISPEPLHERLGAPFLRLVRLRLGDSEPIGIQSTVIVTEQCPGIERVDFNQHSLYGVLSEKYRLPIGEINHSVSATVADSLQAALLQVAAGAPLLIVNTTARLEDGSVIEQTTSFYRADKYEYSTKHTFSPGT
jgi:GntR family transcriptional regulator